MAVLNRLTLVAPPLSRGILSRTRAYGSEAAAQVKYDYEDDEDELNGNRRCGQAMEETEGSVTGRGVQWVIMGDPAVKRHFYAERLAKLLQVPHVSMGTLVRQELHPRSSLYKQIADALNQGKLVQDEVILALLSRRLEEAYIQGETGFILDGIPRTRLQAEILDRIADVDLVVNLKCKEECLAKNYLGYSPSKKFPRMDESCQSSSVDTDGAWKEKLRVYTEQIKTLEDHYSKQKKLVDFHVGAAPGETWQGLLAALHLQHLSGLNSSQELTA